MVTTITMMIGGEERKLVYGTNAAFKYCEDVYKGDPFEILNAATTPAKYYACILASVYVGLRGAGCKESKELIDEWVADLSYEEGARAYITFRQAYAQSNGQAGEAEARKLVMEADA